jgi:tetratricopeptide (TPR) repeat protein
MVGRFGEVLVMDWGLAKVKGREDTASEALVETIRSEKAVGKTLSGEVMGTPSYMPPEQASGKVERIDERSDVFALGAVLYRILTHEPPYAGGTVGEVLTKAVTCAYRAPRVKSPWNRIPKALQSICLKAMRGRMADRYGSVEWMVEDIRAYLDHRPVKAHRAGLLSRFLRFVQRHPAGSLAGGVALILLCLGGALTGVLLQRTEAERAKASEKEALAEAEAARADAASARAQLAEEARDKAEVRATDAEDALKKGRLVSAVLRSANVELGGLLRTLKASFHSGVSHAEKVKAGSLAHPVIEAFGRNVPKDSASQAAWLGVKGLFLRFSCDPQGALAHYEKSKAADPDVAYGDFFEGMHWLTPKFFVMDLPGVVYHWKWVFVDEMPEETEEQRRNWARMEKALKAVEGKPVWGEIASRDFQEVLEGFRAIRKMKWEDAERGLTRALAIPEMELLAEEILLARTRVRYMMRAYGKGLEDIEKVIAAYPHSSRPYFFKARLLGGRGFTLRSEGGDPRPDLKEAIQANTRSLEIDPKNRDTWLQRGGEYMFWAAAERTLGGNPFPLLRKANEDFNECLRLSPGYLDALINRANNYYETAKARLDREEDPRPAIRKSLEDISEVIRIDPDFYGAYIARVNSRSMLIQYLSRLGKDPREIMRKSLADTDKLIRLKADDYDTYLHRGQLFTNLGTEYFLRREDGSRYLEEGLKVCEKAVAMAPDMAEGYFLRGNARRRIGDAAFLRGEDLRIMQQEAVKDYTEAMRLDPEDDRFPLTRGLAYYMMGYVDDKSGKNSSALYRAAIADIKRAMEIGPPNSREYFNCGRVHRSLGSALETFGEDPGDHFETALRLFDRAIGLDPGNGDVLKAKGEMLCLLGRFEEAVKAFEKRLQIPRAFPPSLHGWLSDARTAASGPEWKRKFITAITLKARGLYAKSRTLFVEAFEEAGKARAYEAPRHRDFLFTFHLRYAGLLAQMMTGRTTCRGIKKPITEAEAGKWRALVFQHLHKAVDLGWSNLTPLLTGRDFTPLREHPSFQPLLAELREKLEKRK